MSRRLIGATGTEIERWRYTRCRDGGEELYDRVGDPNEYHNLAGDPRHARLKGNLARWIPRVSAPSKPSKAGKWRRSELLGAVALGYSFPLY